MNLLKLQQTLINAARAQAPDERVPLAFEKRITALIAAIFYLAATQGIEAEEMLVARAAEAPSQP